jgi:hypothetical protein
LYWMVCTRSWTKLYSWHASVVLIDSTQLLRPLVGSLASPPEHYVNDFRYTQHIILAINFMYEGLCESASLFFSELQAVCSRKVVPFPFSSTAHMPQDYLCYFLLLVYFHTIHCLDGPSEPLLLPVPNVRTHTRVPIPFSTAHVPLTSAPSKACT